MCKDPAHPAAKPLELVADPWAFWLILQSRFLKCSQPATDGQKGSDKKNQISFLAQRKTGDSKWPSEKTLTKALMPLGLKAKISPIYGDFYCDFSTIATGSIFRDTDTNTGSADHTVPEPTLDVQVSALNEFKANFSRLKIARPVKPQLREALAAISVPKGNAQDWKRERRGGAGVVVGFVDNGCAFAHPNFIKKDDLNKSRVMCIWDQSWSREDSEYRTPEASEYWTPEVNDFGYGYELEVGEYDLRTGRRDGKKVEGSAELTEDELYAKLGHRMVENVVMDGMFGPADFTHGTHIMDIAVGANGVAPDADIVFVQLPQSAIVENTDQASARHILDGVAYIFRYAAEKKMPAVVNISYNAYTGPHDGTSLLELGLDELLEPRKPANELLESGKPADEQQKPLGRAVVISAGNARDVNCHEFRTVPAKQSQDAGGDGEQTLFWSVSPDDPTENFMEIWYDGRPDPESNPKIDLKISVFSPDGKCVAGDVGPDQYNYLKRDDFIMGAVIHRKDDRGNHKNQVLIALNPTAEMAVRTSKKTDGTWWPADSGIWRVEVRNPEDVPVEFHAWIERDDRGENPVVNQSHFLTSRQPTGGEKKEDGEEFRKATPEEKFTLGGFCTGEKTIVVGAYNLATRRPMPYSSLGPTVDGRSKPDIYAPGASDPGGNGIEAASAMSANLVRLSGTSVAAPFVAGLIAREFSDAESDWRTLDTAGIIKRLKKGGDTIESPDGQKDGPYSIRIRD